VMVEHGALVNTICSMQEIFGLMPGDHQLQFASCSFDASVAEIFSSLCTGGTMYLVPDDVKMDPVRFEQYILLNDINIATLPPAFLQTLNIENLTTLRTLVTAGEKANPVHVQRFTQIGEYINAYGPTETDICASAYKINKGEVNIDRSANVSIGQPLPNVQIYILDKDSGLLPFGAIGEICVGGKGLARGYIHNPTLSKTKFVLNPFVEGEQLYRTGDAGRWLPDGNLDYVGRLDNQVKVHGYRIELEEIECKLLMHPIIEQACVLMKESSDDRYLIAYLVCKQELSDLEIRKELEKEMPPYMIPASYFMLSELPLTRNGKVDRHALLSLESNGQLTRDIHVEPGNPTEFKLVQIWSEILEKRVQGVTEDFFSLGGHSLNITRLLSKIHQVFDTKLELKDLFEKATIREQASLILGSKKELYSEIPVVPVAPDYVLSSSQRRLWILSQFEGGNTAYSLSSTYLLKGELDYNAFQKAFHCLVNRHEILRTVFKEDERGEVKQIVKSIVEIGFKVEFRDSLSKVREEEESRSVKPVSMVQEFDLPKGPLIKPEVIKLSPGQHLFTYSIHHIISDGWSMDILMRELMYYYNSFHSSNLIDQEPLRIHYKDYAALQQSNLSNGVLDRQKKYWLDKLTGAVPVLDLPLDRVRPIIKTFNGERVEMKLEPELFSSFNSLCQKSGATLFMGLLAAVNALLYRYTGQTEILVGTSIAGREHAELEQQVGFYLNELALLNKFSGQDHFLSVLEGVKKSTLGAFENQAYPFDELVSDLKLRRDTSRNPLFDVMVDLQNAGSSKEVTGFHGLTVLNVEGEEPPISRFDLVFNFLQSGQSLLIGMEYNSDLFERNSVQQLLVHLVGLFQSIVDAPEKPIKNLNFLPPAEIETLLVKYNQTKVPFEDEKTIIALFEEQVARTPSRIALVYREKEMTYAELNGWVNRLAAHLLNNYSMQADTLVGLILDRSDWMIIAVLGVLKAGAAYVPLDPEYPLERKKYILEETRSDLIITQSDYVFDLDYFKGDVFAIDIQLHEAPEPDKVLTVFSKPSDLAYVIFTSGSTGRPKGVMIENRSVVNYLSNCSTLYFKEESGGNFGLFSSLSFDLTVTSIFLPLIRGRLIHILTNYPSFSDSIKLYLNSPYNLDSVKITPSHLRILLEVEGDWSNLKTFILGGEELSFELVSLLKKRKSEVDIFNEYGPTESTVGCVVERVDCSSSKIPIGYPMGNTIIRILDSEDQLVPVGVAGEICIAGQGLARGYLHNPGLTSQRFVADPYQDGGLIYKSGDLGRWMPGGAIEYKGRVDDQVKMQGYRIELGEIENVMKEVVGIGGCTVNLFELNGEDRLAGYFEGAEEELGRLKGHLKSRLPDYMIPSVLIPLRSLPLTINGKVDKGKLPSPSENMELNEAEIIRPRNETERLIASAWSDSLGMSEARIGIDSNYFDLGGNSFSIVRMSKVLSEKFSSEISVATLFRFPSIRDLSGYIQNNESEVEPLSTDSYTGLDVMDETFNLISNGEDEQ
jgi:amino acid adenylation domain-containing protein